MKKLYHLKIKREDIAGLVLLPGDPQRSLYIADNFLKYAEVINEYRGLNAYTGYYNNKIVSVVTSGMGAPSAAIVIEELHRLGVHTILRTGTCGGWQKTLNRLTLSYPQAQGR